MQAANLRFLWSRGGVEHSAIIAHALPLPLPSNERDVADADAICQNAKKRVQLLPAAVVNVLQCMRSRGVASHRGCFEHGTVGGKPGSDEDSAPCLSWRLHLQKLGPCHRTGSLPCRLIWHTNRASTQEQTEQIEVYIS